MPDARRAALVAGQMTCREGGGPASLLSSWLSRLKKLEVVNFEGAGKFIDRDNRRVSLSAFQPAYVLLTEAGKLSEALLG